MKNTVSHRDRIAKIMMGEIPDRFAGSVWRHFYHMESTADRLAAAMLHFQRRFDWDFMKINPRASYHVEDWGNKLQWSKSQFQKHKKISVAVNEITDWSNIEPLPMTAPVLSEHLRAVSLIKKRTDPELPLLMTIFNPIGIARYLVGSKEKLLRHLDIDSTAVATALENITSTFEKFAQECRNAGADGIFYATLEWASHDTITYDQYKKLSRPYDLRILKASGEKAMNILHVCGSHNFLRELADYPAPLINWDASDPTNEDIQQSRGFLSDKTVIAGLDHKGWLMKGRPDEIERQMARLKTEVRSTKFIFGPGCAVAPEIPYENLDAVRRSL
jgi:uroporphyrinogen decarboxylase